MCIRDRGYPDAQAERGLLSGVDRREIIAKLSPQMERVELLALQKPVSYTHLW